ncbi:uncharacterized protein ASCRUDRAFT_122377 [Ascoidea rubescens DSM 1968]|uniref:Uncharacterized protein n=1 Tax=Ascoidea rubescens DSM 1968 TaxID=1344418 RepID=A0A1D2V9I4_9ASCO|nr:hypothetical protein ASCRUDRAFT_122377 [Ascoidea rubescens DSM 1968]ODV58332.1 hypothetical protein ASCRUDRAFT_122377 [Ascoidea rubescens DSM 1968]
MYWMKKAKPRMKSLLATTASRECGGDPGKELEVERGRRRRQRADRENSRNSNSSKNSTHSTHKSWEQRARGGGGEDA